MTVSGTTLKHTYTLDSSTTEFAYTFKITASADMLVTLYNTTTRTGTTVSSSDYTVVGAALDSGTRTVTYAGAAAYGSTYQLILQSNAGYTQPTDYINGDDFAEETHELALDRNVILTRQIKEIVDRCLKIDSAQTSQPEFPSGTEGYLYTDGATFSLGTPTATTTDYNGTMAHGADASKPASPALGDLYFATDTNILYKCSTGGSWGYAAVVNTLTAAGAATIAGALGVTGATTLAGTLGFTLGTTINELSTDGTLAGNSDNAVPTEKAVKTYVDAATNVFIGSLTRDMTAASGSVAYTGVGFQPDVVIFLGGVSLTSKTSVGFDNVTAKAALADYNGETTDTNFVSTTYSIQLMESASKMQHADISARGADGFTLAWVKEGAPAAGTATVGYLALKL